MKWVKVISAFSFRDYSAVNSVGMWRSILHLVLLGTSRDTGVWLMIANQHQVWRRFSCWGFRVDEVALEQVSCHHFTSAPYSCIIHTDLRSWKHGAITQLTVRRADEPTAYWGSRGFTYRQWDRLLRCASFGAWLCLKVVLECAQGGILNRHKVAPECALGGTWMCSRWHLNVL